MTFTWKIERHVVDVIQPVLLVPALLLIFTITETGVAMSVGRGRKTKCLPARAAFV